MIRDRHRKACEDSVFDQPVPVSPTTFGIIFAQLIHRSGVMIAFCCPHCGAQLKARADLAGQEGPCPGCGQIVHAPARFRDSPGEAEEESSLHAALHSTPLFPGIGETADTCELTLPASQYGFLRPPELPDELGR